MEIVSVVGARPQFVKAAVVSRALAEAPGIRETLLHTGQHFDPGMSDVFFSQLGIPQPAFNLGVGGGTHGQNTGRMIEAIEAVLLERRPDWVLVYGDTDSTLAGTLAAVKLHVPVAHVEAGLRSFNRRMPEEINRVLTDHASSLLLVPTEAAVRNLAAEGIRGDVVCNVGDVMYDAALVYGREAEQRSDVLHRVGVEPGAYVLATIHRPSNTDEAGNLRSILAAMATSRRPVVWPVHPRTRRRLVEFRLDIPPVVRAIEPVGYLDMLKLEHHARAIVTDSGGVQKEAYFHGVPCLTLRLETEWLELVELGANRLVGEDWAALAAALAGELPDFPRVYGRYPYGQGDAALRIVRALQG